MTETINRSALEPLYAPFEAPNRYRVRGGEIKHGRRRTPIAVAQNLRAAVAQWREGISGEGRYAGASATTIELFDHWFESDHFAKSRSGARYPFRYHFCQREAIETFVYLLEVLRINRLATLIDNFGGGDRETAALGVDPKLDQWAKQAFKMATGAGKTKVMSLAVVWSYFNVLREQDSPAARDFLIVAPNITVFERLREDFAPSDGGPNIFDLDPLIPKTWKGDWNLRTVLQDEPSAAATGGTLYLTNIHRLYEKSPRRNRETETYSWAGPPARRPSNNSETLRERITSHRRLMILNDEAHHLWDPGSAWNDALSFIHTQIQRKGSGADGVVAQLDFSATPKDNKGQLFQDIVCDFPLGEAVDAGIVKTPIIGQAANLKEQPGSTADIKYQRHLLLGYQRWQASKQEWERSGLKPLMFVLTESTDAANQITAALNGSPLFEELNGRTVNLHTNLKGRLKKIGSGPNLSYEFIEDDKAISDEDLRSLRKLARELDTDPQHYCIVSVLMLREGWDVRNVTTIVPLRPLTAKAKILPEQTLGRGLRRMTPPGSADELLTVVEHKAFSDLYRNELSQEGLDIEVVELDKVPRTTVTIYPDQAKHGFATMDIEVPRLSVEFTTASSLDPISFDDVEKRFSALGLPPLQLGTSSTTELDYEGRALLTGEIVQQMKIFIPLLESGIGAISFYREELERMCGIRGTHDVLAPVIEQFLCSLLFGCNVDIEDERLISRVADADLAEYVRATFVLLIRERITQRTVRQRASSGTKLATWRPYQATHSERRPTIPSRRTPFNLVPCDRELEVAFATFATKAPDVRSFAKNAGPQALRIDYLSNASRLAFYTPDFFVATHEGKNYLVETKGREDRDVPLKAKAAVEWCKVASSKAASWKYVYIPQWAFNRLTSNEFAALESLCRPALAELLREEVSPQLGLFTRPDDESKTLKLAEFLSSNELDALSQRAATNARQAVLLFRFLESKGDISFSPAFTPLLGPLEDACTALLVARLSPYLPRTRSEQEAFFSPNLAAVDPKKRTYYDREIKKLERTLLFKSPISPMGHLRFALDIATRSESVDSPLFMALRVAFGNDGRLLEILQPVYEFRNKFIAHQEHETISVALARAQLRQWLQLLVQLNVAL